MIGTTDDPIDTLEWHKKIAADDTISVKVYPSFRPDKAINIHKAGFIEYLSSLARSVGKEQLTTADDVCSALTQRLEHTSAWIEYKTLTELVFGKGE
jgi:glucuronate isomerase